MKIKHMAPLIILSAALLGSMSICYTSYNSSRDLIAKAKNLDLKTAATFLQNDLITQSQIAAARVALILARPDVKQAFKEKNRAALNNLIKPSFDIQKARFGVREMQFNTLPATVFLRLHKPEFFGDDNSSFREMLLMAGKNHKEYQGVEIGRSGVNIRAIDVIKQGEEVVGTFEVGMSFSTILENIKKNIGFDAAVFINDDLITKIASSRPRASQERIFGELQGIGATDWSRILPNMNAELLAKVNDLTLLTQNVNGVDYGVLLMPLMDFKNSEIGVVVAVKNFSNYQNELRESLVLNVSLALMQAIILFGVIIIVLKVLFLRPIETINKQLVKVARGTGSFDLAYLASRKNEIGELATGICLLMHESNRRVEAKVAAKDDAEKNSDDEEDIADPMNPFDAED